MKKYIFNIFTLSILTLSAFGQNKNVRMAESALEKGNLNEAKSLIESATTDIITKGEGKTWFIYGQIYQAIGENLQDYESLEIALRAYYKTKAIEKEGSVYYTFAEQQIQDVWAKNINTGAEKYQEQDFENAIKSFDVAKMALPKDTTAYIYAGISAQQAGNLDVAAENYAYLVDELDYKSEDFYNSLIYIYMTEKQDNKKAVEYLRKAQAAYPENSDFLKREINILINDKNYTEAEQKFTKAIEAEPDNPILYYNRAYLYEQMERDAETVENYKKAIKLDPSYFDANFNLAAFYFNKAAEILTEANNMDLKEYQKRGREIEDNSKVYFELSLPYLEKSKELKPDDAKVLSTLQTVYTRLGMEEKAFALESSISDKKNLLEDGNISSSEVKTVSSTTDGELIGLVNGKPTKIKLDDNDFDKIQFLGDTTDLLKNGINYFVSDAGKEFTLWVEEIKVKFFPNPYEKSYAILVAIDDYDRINDSKGRGPTGYKELGSMVNDAKKLKTVLKKHGFNNIIELYDAQATKTNIERTLNKFWPGGEYGDADRLFFYFGGHGDAIGDHGFLVTYDFDRKMPTSSTFLMQDLTIRQSKFNNAYHFMVAIDACHSGLATYGSLGDDDFDKIEMNEFRSLTAIKRLTDNKARNVLVAGTENQSAIFDNGGIFTKSLINGLNNRADYNKDGIIEFDELYLYVKQDVRMRSASMGIVQTPKAFILDQEGEGRLVFYPERYFE